MFGGNDDSFAWFPDPNNSDSMNRVGLRQMFKEVTGQSDPLDYEMFYGTGSQQVHSAPFSLGHILGVLHARESFVLASLPSSEACTLAVGVANGAMLMALEAVSEYAGLGLDDELERLRAWVKRNDRQLNKRDI